MKAKTRNIIRTGLITAVVGYFLISFVFAFRYCHRIKFIDYHERLSYFQDTVKCHVDTFVCTSNIRESDALFWYSLYNKSKTKYLYDFQYNVLFWEFYDLNSIDLKSVFFNENVNLDDVKFDSGEDLNPKSTPHLLVRFKMPFDNSMIININDKSKITKWIDAGNYKGFIGKINKFSLSNNRKEHLALVDNDLTQVQSMVLIYKNQSRLCLIYVFSDYDFDENVIKLFKLK